MARIDTSEFRYARDRQSRPVDGALLFVYVGNTNTLASLFSDDALSVSVDNPVVASSGGDFTDSLYTSTTSGVLRLEITGPYGDHLPNSPAFVMVANPVSTAVDDYTVLSSDAGKVVVITKGSAVAATINPGVFNVGDRVTFVQGGAGALTVQGATVGDDTSTVNVDATFTAVLAGQYSVAEVICIAADTFVITGDLVAA